MKYVKLGEICEFINGDRGKNYPSGKDFVDKGIPFINAGHIQNNDINFENMNYISREKFNALGSGKVRKNDILYCLRGSLGKNAIVNIEEGAIASSLVILRPKSEFTDVDYLINYLNSNFINEQILKANNGSSQPNLSAASVKNFNILLPSYEEQKDISKILRKSKDLIYKRKEQINALDELVKSQFIEMFGNPLNNSKGWEETTLDYYSNLVTYGLTVRPNYIEDGIPLISAKEIRVGVVDYSSAPKISMEDYNGLSEKGKPRKNDILFSKTGSIGHCALIESNDIFAITQNAARISLDLDIINPVWCLYYLRTDYIQEWCQNKSKGNAVKDFQLQDMKKIPFYICDIHLQNQFADFVKQTDKLKFEMEKSLKELENNFNSLMQRAFKGELFN